MQTNVIISKTAKKQLNSVPKNIKLKFYVWVAFLRDVGMSEVRKSRGFHDEALRGQRQGQRSIRLSRSYRAIYVEKDGAFELIEILEVNKHDY